MIWPSNFRGQLSPPFTKRLPNLLGLFHEKPKKIVSPCAFQSYESCHISSNCLSWTGVFGAGTDSKDRRRAENQAKTIHLPAVRRADRRPNRDVQSRKDVGKIQNTWLGGVRRYGPGDSYSFWTSMAMETWTNGPISRMASKFTAISIRIMTVEPTNIVGWVLVGLDGAMIRTRMARSTVGDRFRHPKLAKKCSMPLKSGTPTDFVDCC